MGLFLQAFPSLTRAFGQAERVKPRYVASKQRVDNRGVPPDAFLDELIAWGRTAPEDLFTPSAHKDVYANVEHALGPWSGIEQRRAAMLEVMRVLAGFESSWNWDAGRDMTNPRSVAAATMEAGAWQISADSMHFGKDLRALVLRQVGTLDGNDFQRATKQNHPFAMEYVARLLRITVNHNGPVKDHKIDPWLRKDAVAEFLQLLAEP
ncbi:hypothetical protein [Granulicella rosea]|nr:hypothetical protein [Granulicella rosea]